MITTNKLLESDSDVTFKQLEDNISDTLCKDKISEEEYRLLDKCLSIKWIFENNVPAFDKVKWNNVYKLLENGSITTQSLLVGWLIYDSNCGKDYLLKLANIENESQWFAIYKLSTSSFDLSEDEIDRLVNKFLRSKYILTNRSIATLIYNKSKKDRNEKIKTLNIILAFTESMDSEKYGTDTMIKHYLLNL